MILIANTKMEFVFLITLRAYWIITQMQNKLVHMFQNLELELKKRKHFRKFLRSKPTLFKETEPDPPKDDDKDR